MGNLFRQSVNINFVLIKTITSYLLHILIKQNKDIGVIFLGPPAFGKIKPRTVINYILKKKKRKKKQKEIVNFRCRINVDAEYKYYITGFIRCLFIHQQKKIFIEINKLNPFLATENFHSALYKFYLFRFSDVYTSREFMNFF